MDGGQITYWPDGGFDTSPCLLPSTDLTFVNNDPANALTVCFKQLASPGHSPFKNGGTSITVPGNGGSKAEKVHEYKLKTSVYKYKKGEDGGCIWSDNEGPSEGGMTGTVEVASGGGHSNDPPDSAR